MTTPTGVLPDVSDPDFAPFWAAAREHRIEVPACGQAHLTWPPRPVCPRCFDTSFAWTPVASSGTLYTWTVVHQPTVESMPGPYVVAIVELDGADGVRLLGNIWGLDPAELEVGMPLRASFDAVSDECTLINWARA